MLLVLQNQARTLLCGKNEITDKNQINNQLHHSYKTLFTQKFQVQNEKVTAYLNQISIAVFTGEQSQTCEGPVLENELLKTLKNKSHNCIWCELFFCVDCIVMIAVIEKALLQIV